MQKFPNDSRDAIEQKYGNQVLNSFPSYGKFWEKFIGDDKKYSHVLTPRSPHFPKDYPGGSKIKFKNTQLWLSKVSYSIFYNLVAAEYQLEEYKKTLPITNEHLFFSAIESFECGYFHIGNITYGLKELWGRIKNNFFESIDKRQNFVEYLVKKQQDKNLNDLYYGEAKAIRDDLVHFGRHIFTQHKGELYLPLNILPRQYLWSTTSITGWIPASMKLGSHIKLAYQTCEDVFSSVVPDIDAYLNKQGIKM